MSKKCGVLLPIFSLPSKYGIGTFGKWAYKFIDLLKECGHSYWQILPIVQTGYGDSPYSSCADCSGNPYFIDLEILREQRLLTYREVEAAISKGETVDYHSLYNERYLILRKAFSRFNVSDRAFKSFLAKGEFNNYALFMSLKQAYNSAWYEWKDCFKFRDSDALRAFEADHKQEVLFWQFLQFAFERQYKALKKYANQKGIRIIGDLPLYVALDSVDVWVNPKDFMLDSDLKPTVVAGVPPDCFSKTGQLWGNPIYNYKAMEQNGFSFWKKRVARARRLFDLVRIDHFRGFDRYWAVPNGLPTAENGRWEDAPKMKLLNAIGTKNLFAEDLGLIDEGVKQLLYESGLCGTKVLLFAFDSDRNNLYLPWNVDENSVIYTGTHDNNTVIGTLKALSKEDFERQKAMVKDALSYLRIYRIISGVHSVAEAIVDIAYASKAKITIVPMQDILGLDENYRINTPGECGCWRVRLKESLVFSENTRLMLKRRAKRFNRN